MFDEVITHLEKALEYGQDTGVPIEILDKIDDVIALIEEHELDLEAAE